MEKDKSNARRAQDPELADIGKRISEARGRRSQRELANQIGIDVSTLSRIETGRFNPTITTLKAVAKALGLSIDYLATGEEAMPQASPLVGEGSHLEATLRGMDDDIEVLARRLLRVERALEEQNILVPAAPRRAVG